jgi:hypothetical protein
MNYRGAEVPQMRGEGKYHPFKSYQKEASRRAVPVPRENHESTRFGDNLKVTIER